MGMDTRILKSAFVRQLMIVIVFNLPESFSAINQIDIYFNEFFSHSQNHRLFLLIQMLYLQSSNAFLNPKNQRGI
jgi:hypothetical protein